MKGWTVAGRDIELSAAQENAVRLLLAWDRGANIQLRMWGRGGGKSVVLATVARYAQARAMGEPLECDPLFEDDERAAVRDGV